MFGVSDWPKPEVAILNTRLRQLARLEEMELRREHEKLSTERDGLNAVLASQAEHVIQKLR